MSAHKKRRTGAATTAHSYGGYLSPKLLQLMTKVSATTHERRDGTVAAYNELHKILNPLLEKMESAPSAALISDVLASQTTASETKSSISSNVCALYYNGVITGSKELREYNESYVCKQYNKYGSPGLGTPIDYYTKYDAGPKKEEPFFDAFLVHLAMIDKSKLKNNNIGDLKKIKYYRANIQDDNKTPNQGEKSSLTSVISQKDFVIPPGIYAGAKHIFIMSPMTNNMNEEIKEYCNSQKKNGTNVIIHIQGDSVHNSYEGGNEHKGKEGTGKIGADNGLTAKRDPITKKVGMFPDAFNLFSGGIATQNFRKYLKENNAVVGSVSPVTGIEWKGNDSKPVPDYYKEVNDLVLQFSSKNSPIYIESSKFAEVLSGIIPGGLDIHKVYQDGTDKDNLASLILLGGLNKERLIKTDFIGLRLYKSSTIPFPTIYDYEVDELGNYKVDELGIRVLIDKDRKHTFKFGSSRLDINGEWSSPADKNPKYGNLPFDTKTESLTRKFYIEQRKGFTNVLTPYAQNIVINGIHINKDVDIAKFIVDGLGLISESLRAPFNMSLFWFAPETYQYTALKNATNKSNRDAMLAIKGVNQSSVSPSSPSSSSSSPPLSSETKDDIDVDEEGDAVMKGRGGRKRRRKSRRKSKRKKRSKRRKSKRRKSKRRKSKKRRKSRRKRRTKRR
uniref:Uncharacterized protein n=1 Tax=viral metagenome TaxID=1070528 RepID=A0A6C0F9T2_9ZZZZ|tara:strand:- start:331 stop:2355 length:2025 start_codon:yes stop_codon:yes gene_type:complete